MSGSGLLYFLPRPLGMPSIIGGALASVDLPGRRIGNWCVSGEELSDYACYSQGEVRETVPQLLSPILGHQQWSGPSHPHQPRGACAAWA